MNSSQILRLFIFVIVGIAMLAPGFPVLVRSPYGLEPTVLWLAALYLLVAAVLSVWLCSHLIQTVRVNSVWRRNIICLVIVALVPILWLVAALLPFAALLVVRAVSGSVPLAGQWYLMNKYIGHFATSALQSHFWLLAPVAAGTWAWFHAAKSASARVEAGAKNAP